jgi:uncharacterized protein YbjQ (UPF0145 family)
MATILLFATVNHIHPASGKPYESETLGLGIICHRTREGSWPVSADDILVVTTTEAACTTVVRVLAPVDGAAVHSRSVVGNALRGLRATFGGSQPGYGRLLRETRAKAIRELQAHAALYGANAVIGMRFDSGEFDASKEQSMAEITAYGTAVILEAASRCAGNQAASASRLPKT